MPTHTTHHISIYTHMHLHIPYMHIYTHVYPYTRGTQIHTSTTDIQYIYTHTHTMHISTHITVDIYPHHKHTNTFLPHAYIHTLHKYTHHTHTIFTFPFFCHVMTYASWILIRRNVVFWFWIFRIMNQIHLFSLKPTQTILICYW